MNARERAGRRLYLILATLLILEKVSSVALVLAGGNLAEVNWLKSVVQPIGFALAVGFLWNGDNGLRWLVGMGCITWGAITAMLMGTLLWALYARTPPDKMDVFMMFAYPLMFIAVVGLLHVLTGFLFLLSPSMRAFFRYQREGPESIIQWAGESE